MSKPNKLELLAWIIGLPDDSGDLPRVDAIRRKESPEDPPKRFGSGMLRQMEMDRLDKMGKLLRECIRQERIHGNIPQADLDFWEKRLWSWADEAHDHRKDQVELDAETWAAIHEIMRMGGSGGGKVKVRDDRYHTIRRFVLSSVQAVCAGLVNGKWFIRRFDGCGGVIVVDSVTLRAKTDVERNTDRLIQELHRPVESREHETQA